jgi:hypothetical protein
MNSATSVGTGAAAVAVGVTGGSTGVVPTGGATGVALSDALLEGAAGRDAVAPELPARRAGRAAAGVREIGVVDAAVAAPSAVAGLGRFSGTAGLTSTDVDVTGASAGICMARNPTTLAAIRQPAPATVRKRPLVDIPTRYSSKGRTVPAVPRDLHYRAAGPV